MHQLFVTVTVRRPNLWSNTIHFISLSVYISLEFVPRVIVAVCQLITLCQDAFLEKDQQMAL